MKRHTVFIRCGLLLSIVLIVLVMLAFSTSAGPVPARAQASTPPPSCTWGDLVCELQQAGDNLIASYVNPLKDWFRRQTTGMVDGIIYNIAKNLATFGWGGSKAITQVAINVASLNDWIATNLFQPLIKSTSSITGSSVQIMFVIALMVLGFTYLFSMFVRWRVVSLQDALLWLLAGAVFFQVGPTMYSWMQDLRHNMNGYFYQASMDAMNQTSSPFSVIANNSNDTSGSGAMPTPCNNFPVKYVGTASSNVNGMDISLAYLKADGVDVLNGANNCLADGTDMTDLPRTWYNVQGYFDTKISPPAWDDPALSVDDAIKLMETANKSAFAGVSRLFNGFLIVIFGVVEQLLGLCLTIAFGLTFISFSIAILFAFFKRTEVIAWTVFNQWISLIIQSLVIAVIQSMVMVLYISAATQKSGVVTLAVGVVGLVLMAVLLWSGIKAIWNAFNCLFNAFGQATGGAIIAPGTAAGAMAGTAMAFAGAAATGGMSMMSGAASIAGSVAGGADALSNGATWGQAAGVMLGGSSKALDGAAFQITRLPGMQNTALGEVANQYMEGSATRRIGDGLLGDVPVVGGALAPLLGARVGASLLSDRNPQNDQAWIDDNGNTQWRSGMLNSGTDKAMSRLLTGTGKGGWDGENAVVGQGGTALTDDDGSPLRRRNLEKRDNPNAYFDASFTRTPEPDETARKPVSPVVMPRTFALDNEGNWTGNAKPAENGSPSATPPLAAPPEKPANSPVMPFTIGLNNTGDLDETVDEDFKRDLRANDESHKGDNSSGAARLDSAAAKLEASSSAAGASLKQSADALGRSAQNIKPVGTMQPLEGRLNVSGADNIAAVMQRTIDSLAKQNKQTGQVGANQQEVSAAMAGAVGIKPVIRDDKAVPPIERNVDRYQTFADQALTMGVSGRQARQVIQEVKSTPDGRLSPETRHRLISDQHKTQSWADSVQSVRTLEGAARSLPTQMSAYGQRTMPTTSGTAPIVLSPANGSGGGPVIFEPTKTQVTQPVQASTIANRSTVPLPVYPASQPIAQPVPAQPAATNGNGTKRN